MPTLLIRKHSKGINRSVPASEIEPGEYVKLENLRVTGEALEPRPGQKRYVNTRVGPVTPDPVTGLLRAYLTGSASAIALGPRAPATAANDASFGTNAWSGTGNVFASDDARATVLADGSTQYLKITNFGFAVPSGAVIAGILVEVERSELAAAGGGGEGTPVEGPGSPGGGLSVFDARVRIVKGGAIGATERADTTIVWPGTDTFKSYGGAADLWGETWAFGDLNASTFGVAIAATVSAGSTARIDFVRITVYYFPAAPGKMTLAFVDKIYRDSGAPGSEWVDISAANVLQKGANLETLVWHNTAFFQDGVNGPYKYDGTTFAVWSSAGPKTTPPIGKFMLLDVERMYIAGLKNDADGGPSGIRISTRDDHDDFPLTPDPAGDDGALWKAGKDDGDYISGVGQLGTLKFFFKRRTAYLMRGDNADTWDLSKFLPVGAVTHRVIQNCGNLLCWTDGRRVYSYGADGLNLGFGFKVEKLLAQTPIDTWQNLAAVFWDGLYLLWYRPDEAVGYDFRTESWCGPWVGLPMRCALVDRDDDTIWFGRSDEAYVWRLSELSDFTGAGSAVGINVVAETGAYDFQEADWIKRARQAIVRADGTWGATNLSVNGSRSQLRPFAFSGMTGVQQLQQPLSPGNDSHFYSMTWTATMPTTATSRPRLYMLGLRADRVRRTFAVA